jgi:calpain-15
LKEFHLVKFNEKGEENLVDDVVQGALGDCYFLSALSAMAEYKGRIIDIFKSRETSKIGIYKVMCYIHGKEIELVLDDYFPCILNDNKPQLAFSSIEVQDNNIWPLLLEKAWAKVNKNYDNIIDGNAGQAFQFLTPSGIEMHYHTENYYGLYKHIKDADDKKFILCCDISEKPNAAPLSILTSLGLLTNHAYSIISAQ